MQDPIHQFAITNLFSVARFGPYELFFTNSAIFMFITVGLIGAFLIGTTESRQLVAGRAQVLAEGGGSGGCP
jgi:F-type H+-transporting ATPase subunit a